MRPLVKVGVVAAGYIAAFFVASAGTYAYVAATPAVDRSTGMSAFGDGMFFLAALAAASVPATGAGLYFLRPYPRFWNAIVTLALVTVPVTLVAAFALIWHSAMTRLPGAALAPLWMLLPAPALAGISLVAAPFAPSRAQRVRLLALAAVHGGAFLCVMLTLMTRR